MWTWLNSYFWNSVLTNLALLSLLSSIFLYLKASFHLHSNKQSFILYSKNLLFLMKNSTTFNNFRPISNLNFISKILEKVVDSRIQSNSLSSSFQSAYRVPFHWNHTSRYSQWPHLSDGSWWGHFFYSSWFICCLRYCSILLHRLQHWFGLHGWFSSYLTSRSQAVLFIFLKSFLWCT